MPPSASPSTSSSSLPPKGLVRRGLLPLLGQRSGRSLPGRCRLAIRALALWLRRGWPFLALPGAVRRARRAGRGGSLLLRRSLCRICQASDVAKQGRLLFSLSLLPNPLDHSLREKGRRIQHRGGAKGLFLLLREDPVPRKNSVPPHQQRRGPKGSRLAGDVPDRLPSRTKHVLHLRGNLAVPHLANSDQPVV